MVTTKVGTFNGGYKSCMLQAVKSLIQLEVLTEEDRELIDGETSDNKGREEVIRKKADRNYEREIISSFKGRRGRIENKQDRRYSDPKARNG